MGDRKMQWKERICKMSVKEKVCGYYLGRKVVF